MTRSNDGADTVVPMTSVHDDDAEPAHAAAADEEAGSDDLAVPASERAHRGGMTGRQWTALAIVVPLVLVAAFLGGRALRDDDAPPGLQIDPVESVATADWNYVIPAGTAARIEAGEDVQIVPAELVVKVGDTIRIENDDSVGHIVGVFFVGAGETMTQQFQSVGELTGECSVHPSGSFTLRVEEA